MVDMDMQQELDARFADREAAGRRLAAPGEVDDKRTAVGGVDLSPDPPPPFEPIDDARQRGALVAELAVQVRD